MATNRNWNDFSDVPLGYPAFNDLLEQVYSREDIRNKAGKWIEQHSVASVRFSKTIMKRTDIFIHNVSKATPNLSWGQTRIGKSSTFIIVVVQHYETFKNLLLAKFPTIVIHEVMEP